MPLSKNILWSFLQFFAIVIERGIAQMEHEKSTKSDDSKDLQSALATMTFLLFSAAFLACIWCTCCMDDLYSTMQRRRSIAEDNV